MARYLIALGGNQWHPHHGAPAAVLRAAFAALDADGLTLIAASPIIQTAPLGPSWRRFANAAAIIETDDDPAMLLKRLKHIERRFGRRPHGGRWRARVLDLDIVLWSGGVWTSPGLTVPHRAYQDRTFVLAPAAAIAPRWRDPKTGLSMKHAHARLTKRRSAPIGGFR